MRMPTALTIAGSDSGGGAGIQADLKTFGAFGVFGMSAVTAITAQNTTGVFGVQEIDPELVEKQIRVVVEDLGVDAAKTGMLASVPIIEAVARSLREVRLPFLVVDPVMRAKGGDPLLHPHAQDALIQEILPLADVVTPNLPEAEALVGFPIRTEEDRKEAARQIHAMGPRWVIIKGGHGEGDQAVDLIYDGQHFHTVSAPRMKTPHTHGTGCTFSAAIAAGVARGLDPLQAIRVAKRYITGAIQHHPGLGKGHGPLHHFWAGTVPFPVDETG